MNRWLTLFSIFSWQDWLDVSLSLVVFSLLIAIIYKIAKRKIFILPYVINAILVIASYIVFGTNLLTLVLLINFILIMIVFMFVNIAALRPFINNLFPTKKVEVTPVRQSIKVELIDIIYEAVSYLSKTKTGAIITIERKINLSEYIKNGTILNAPLTSEMLMTIFYPGTRLHDGAVVIKDNLIVAASVYFPPTTKPLSGKYGSRHRAALGITEVSDAVVVVVSEETGRISFAHAGELEPVFIDQFKVEFAEHLDITYSSKERE